MGGQEAVRRAVFTADSNASTGISEDRRTKLYEYVRSYFPMELFPSPPAVSRPAVTEASPADLGQLFPHVVGSTHLPVIPVILASLP